jgi:hypothetical protein
MAWTILTLTSSLASYNENDILVKPGPAPLRAVTPKEERKRTTDLLKHTQYVKYTTVCS